MIKRSSPQAGRTQADRAGAEVCAQADCVIELESGLSDYGRMPLFMPVVQLFAYHRALALGKTVD